MTSNERESLVLYILKHPCDLSVIVTSAQKVSLAILTPYHVEGFPLIWFCKQICNDDYIYSENLYCGLRRHFFDKLHYGSSLNII